MIEIDYRPDPFEDKVREFKRDFSANQRGFASYCGRVIAHRMFVWTAPISRQGNPWPEKSQVKSDIERDVKLMYPTWDDADWFSGVYRMVQEERGKDAAGKWWHTYKQQEHGGINQDVEFDPESGGFNTDKIKDARSMAKRRGFIQSKKIDDARYTKKRRKFAPKSFPSDEGPIAMVANRQRALNARLKRRGMAKAAWRQAADTFGKSRNLGRGKFKMQWSNKSYVVNKATGGKVGAGNLLISDATIHIMVHNKIRYAREAIQPDHYIKALDGAETQIKVVMGTRLKAMARKIGRKQRIAS